MNILITGKTGTGKTVLLRAIKRLFESDFVLDANIKGSYFDEGLDYDAAALKKTQTHLHKHSVFACQTTFGIPGFSKDVWDIVIHLDNDKVGPWLFDRISCDAPDTRYIGQRR